MPKEPEVHGLVSLLELQESRAAARTGPSGEPVLLKDQNRRRWNRLLIRRGFAALGRASAVTTGPPGPTPSRPPSPPATPRRTRTRTRTGRRSPPCTDCSATRSPSPAVELHRAVAVSMAEGPAPAPQIVDRLAWRTGPALYPPAAQRPGRPAGPPRPARRRPARSSNEPRAWPEPTGTRAAGDEGAGLPLGPVVTFPSAPRRRARP